MPIEPQAGEVLQPKQGHTKQRQHEAVPEHGAVDERAVPSSALGQAGELKPGLIDLVDRPEVMGGISHGAARARKRRSMRVSQSQSVSEAMP